MRVLLLGGNGFIGDYLVRKLKLRTDLELRVVGRELSPIEATNSNYLQFDLAVLNEKFELLLNWSDVIIVLTRDDGKIIDNLQTVLSVRNRPVKIVFVSTLLLYPESDKPQDENVLPDPQTEYEKLKYVEEQTLFKLVEKNSQCKLCVVRMANVYGDVKNGGVINSIFVSCLLKNSPLRINGQGDVVRDYIYIEDAADFLSSLIFWSQEKSFEIVNICTGRGCSVAEIKKIIEEMAGVEVATVNLPPIQEKQSIIGDNNKILTLSGGHIKHDILQGLKKTFENYKNHLNL